MKHTLTYFISLICLCLSYTSFAQKETKKDSINPNYIPKTYGLRFGADIIRPIVSLTNNNPKGFELVADYRINTKTYIAAEAGFVDHNSDENLYNFDSDGTYLKIGINRNMYVNWLNLDNEIFYGFRYGTNLYNHTINSYTVFQQGTPALGTTFFEPKKVTESREIKSLNSHWVALVFGIKVETFKNLYLGFMLSVNRILVKAKTDNFESSYLPGFGNISENGGGSSLNYTITYRIPLYKK